MSRHPPEVVELISALAETFHEQQARWFLFGAQAVLVWGRPRTSADVDVTADIDPQEASSFVDRMQEHGFRVRSSDPEAVMRRTRVVPLLHLPTNLPLDVVLAGPGLEQEFLDRAVEVELGKGVTAPVITAEDLVIGKVLAGRPKDLEDVRGVVHERLRQLDRQRIRAVLAMLEQALDRRDLLSVFEGELQRAEEYEPGEGR